MKRSSISEAVTQLQEHRRKGVFFVLAVISLMAAMTFVGMSVDLGMITVTKTRMQASADSAALAAAQEIVVGIRAAAEQGESDMQTIQAIAAAAAKTMAVRVVELNGFYIDPAIDVSLGSRLLNEDGVTYTESYGTPPYNMVRVEIRKTNTDPTASDAKLPLIFAPVVGERAQAIRADAVAFIESRDIVAVLDYSGSMAFDSQFRSDTVSRLGLTGVADGLDDIWDALVASDVRFSDETGTAKFPVDGFGEIDSYAGTYVSSSSTDTIFEALNLGGTGETTYYYDSWTWTSGWGDGAHWYLIEGSYRWEKYPSDSQWSSGVWRIRSDFSGGWWNPPDTSAPGYQDPITEGGDYVAFPQEGKDGNGILKGKPSQSESETLWHGYISYVKNNLSSYGYQKDYGYRTLMQYLISQKKANYQSEDLWRAPIYPHHGMKEGVTMLATFLNNLGYGDHLGLVTYATTSRIETGLWEDGADVTVDLLGEHLTDNVMAIDTIQRHKQAGHYNSSTGIGYGLEDARDLLDDQGRYGAQKAILLMTDGQSNQYPSGYGTGSLPAGWIWNDITDFDGNGAADVIIDSSYVSGGNGDGNWRAALHSFVRAKEAFDAGYTIHTISMGDGADTTLMNAIAEMSGGEYVHIASGTSNAQMEIELEGAFAVMAGQVPPARLLVDSD
ncbi:MAG: vWA domain-containing protein [Fuerstiella sp.]